MLRAWAAAGLLAGLPATGTAAADRTPAQMEADCWYQFMEADSPQISCAFPALMEKEDRDSVRKLTREVFKDARCEVTIKLERALIDAAVKEPDIVFKSPPQPVACTVETSKGKLPIKFTFAPKIDIKAGKAVKATPGMEGVTGVNSWLAWPVVAYINASDQIENVMIRVVNAYLARKRK